MSWVDWSPDDVYATGRVAADILDLPENPVPEDVRAVMAVREQAARWQSGGQDLALLYTGGVLRDAEKAALRLPTLLTEGASVFLAASSLAEDGRRRAERRRLRRFIASLSILAAGLAVVAFIALIFWRQANISEGHATISAQTANKSAEEARKQAALAKESESRAVKALTLEKAAKQAEEAAKQEREAARRIAVGRSLASLAAAHLEDHPQQIETAILLAIEAARREPSATSDRTLRTLSAVLPRVRWNAKTVVSGTDPVPLNQIAFSGDGAVIAIAAGDSLQTFDTQTGRQISTLQPFASQQGRTFQNKKVLAVALNQRGTVAVAVGSDETVAIDLAKRRNLWRRLADRITEEHAIRITSDDALVVGSPEDTILGKSYFPGGVLQLAGGNPLPRPVALAPSDCRGNIILLDRAAAVVVCSTGGQLIVAAWDAKEARRIPVHPLGADRYHFDEAAISGDGRFIAITLTDEESNHELLVHEAATGSPVIKTLLHGTGTPLAFSNDGRLLAVGGSNRTVSVYSVWARGLVSTFQSQSQAEHIVFQPEGHLIAVQSERLVQLFDPRLGLEVLRGGTGAALAFRQDGRQLAVENRGLLSLLEVPRIAYAFPPVFEGNPNRAKVPFNFVQVGISTDGRSLFHSNSQTVDVVSLLDGSTVSRPTVCIAAEAYNARRGLACLAERKLEPERNETHLRIILEDPQSGSRKTIDAPTLSDDGGTQDLEWSADGTALLLFHSGAQQLLVYEGPQFTRVLDKRTAERIQSAVISGDGKRVAVIAEEASTIYEVKTGQALRRITDRCALPQLPRAALNSSGALIALACGTHLRIYGSSERPLLNSVLPAAADGVRFSFDDQLLIAWAGDTMIVYDIASARELARVRHRWAIQDATLLPDGRYLVSLGKDASIERHPWPTDWLAQEACSILQQKELTEQEWRLYIPGEERRPSCLPH